MTRRRIVIAIVAILLWPAVVRADGAAAWLPRPVVSGFLQADYIRSQESEDQLNDANAEPLNQNRFLIRRARVKVSGSGKFLDYAVEADFNTTNGAQAGLRQIEAGIKLPWPGRPPFRSDAPPLLRLGGGVFRAPFGYETVDQFDTVRLFAERALVSTAFFPGEFDLGAQLQGGLSWLRVTFAVQNGEPLGSRPFPGRDPNDAKDLIGRILVRLPVRRLKIETAFSAAWGQGFSPGTGPTKTGFFWRDVNEDGIVQLSELQGIPSAASTPSQNFTRWGVEGDVRLRLPLPRIGELTVYAEADLGSNLDRGVRPANPVFLGHDLRERGFYGAFTQEVTRWGLVGFRFDYYEPAIDNAAAQGGQVVRSAERFYTYDVAAAFRYEELSFARLRLLVDYSIRRYPLGRDAAGKPANIRADVLTVRLQAEF